MECKEVHALLETWCDGELDAEQHRQVATHLSACEACGALARSRQDFSQMLKGSAREQLPPDLAARLNIRLQEQIGPAQAVPAPIAQTAPRWRSLLRQAAVLLMACSLSALAAWQLTLITAARTDYVREALAAHVRGLLHDPVQFASNDRHMVKPWFTGRLEFAPPVKDLSADGFPLVGGRLDYLSGQRIAAVVYKRRQHVITVFMRPHDGKDPSLGAATGTIRKVSSKGYNGICWVSVGIENCAISDLNTAELGQFQRLL